MLEKKADEMVEDILQVVNNDDNHHESVEEENLRILESLLKHIAENAKFYKVILTSKRSPIFTDRLFDLMAEIISAHQEKRRVPLIIPRCPYRRTLPFGTVQQP